MPYTPAGGIAAGLEQAMGMARDMRAIQSSEAQADLIKQETAAKELQVNELKRKKELATKPIALSNYLSTVPNVPGYRDKVAQEMKDAGAIMEGPDGTPYTNEEKAAEYHATVNSNRQRTIDHLSMINAGFSSKITEMNQEIADPKTKLERKAELQQQLPLIQKDQNDHIKTMLDADMEFKQKEAIEQAKAEAKPAKEASWSATHRLKDGTPIFTSTAGAMKVGSVTGPDYDVQKNGKVFALNTPEVSPTSIYIQNAQNKLATEVTSDALMLAASQFLQTGQMPALGMGNANLRMKVLNKAAEMAKSSGINPLQVPVFQAEFNANKQALVKMTKDTSSFEAFEKGMIKNAEYAKSLSKNYKRSDYPSVNLLINAFRNQAGDPNIVKLTNGIYAASLEYEKIRTAGTGITSAELSIGAQKKAEELMGSAQNHKQLSAAIDVMKVDARNIVSSRKEQMAELKKILGSWGKQNNSSPTPVVPVEQPGIWKQVNGVWKQG